MTKFALSGLCCVLVPSLSSDKRAPPVLIAEDDDNDFFFFETRVRQAGINNPIVRFSDGEQARVYLESVCGLPLNERRLAGKILFLDIKLPRINGFEILAWARQQRALHALGIIIMSGSDETSDIQRATQLGADLYLVKYASKEQLAAAIEAVSAGKRPRAERRRPK